MSNGNIEWVTKQELNFIVTCDDIFQSSLPWNLNKT